MHTLQVIDRYKYMSLLPLTPSELRSIGYSSLSQLTSLPSFHPKPQVLVKPPSPPSPRPAGSGGRHQRHQ